VKDFITWTISVTMSGVVEWSESRRPRARCGGMEEVTGVKGTGEVTLRLAFEGKKGGRSAF